MPDQQLKPIAVLGAGAWGTALALYLARQNQDVRLWSIIPAEIEALLKDQENKRFLPGFPLPENILATDDLSTAISNVTDILIVVPSAGYRNVLSLLKPLLQPGMQLISASKGLDEMTSQLPNEMVEEILGAAYPFAVLSGPSFAKEVAAGLPCAVDIASNDKAYLNYLKTRFSSSILKVHITTDVIGVEIGGILKNVFAIGTGILDGLEMGANARSALITFGLDETIKLGLALGGKLETFVGLSGLGDLILTCGDNQSRNRRMGLSIAKGENTSVAEKEIGQVVEGKRNAELIVKLAQQSNVKMPVTEKILEILQNKIAPAEIASIFSNH